MKTSNKLQFELFYSNCFCMECKSLDKAIKYAKENFENNEGMNDSYTVRQNGFIIAKIKCDYENQTITIE